jgi:hypothetical protein
MDVIGHDYPGVFFVDVVLPFAIGYGITDYLCDAGVLEPLWAFGLAV